VFKFGFEKAEGKRGECDFGFECIFEAFLEIFVDSFEVFLHVRHIVLLEILMFYITNKFGDVVVKMQVDHAYVGDDTVDPEKWLFARL